MRKILLVVVTAGLLAGCAQPRTYQEDMTMRGAAVGAGTGALVGGLAGGTAGSAVAGGILGGLAGGLIGNAAAAPPPPPPEECYARTRSGRMRPVPCD